MKKYLFLVFISLFSSTPALADEITLPKNRIKIELPSNCQVTSDTNGKTISNGKTVSCTDPVVDVLYQEDSFETLAISLKMIQKDAKSLFEKQKNMKILSVSEYEITPLDQNGEIHEFIIFMDVQGTQIIQHYTLISLDKTLAFYAIQTHKAIESKDIVSKLLKVLTTIKRL